MKKSKKAYEEYLNSLSPSFSSDEWIIGGKRRVKHADQQLYGEAIRKYDPIAFEVGYREWQP